MLQTKLIANIALIASLALAFNGCSVKTGNSCLENIKKEEVTDMLVKGQTTEEGARSLFGEPQATDFLEDGRKKWRYTFVTKREKGINYIPVVNWFSRGTNDSTKTLLILFKDGVVNDYIFSTAVGETKAGVFN